MPAFDCVFLDLGGVVYIGDTPIAGSIEAVDRLRRSGCKLRFLTNTTRTPWRTLLARLRAMGLEISDDELFTPAKAARVLIESENLAPHLLVAPALEVDFGDPGPGLEQDKRRAVVVGDAGEGFTYERLNLAFRELMDGAEFLALANNRHFRDADGGFSLDAGPFVQALAFASGKTPVVLGKPSRDFFRAALASAGAAAERTVMIGDDAESDVGGALAAGLSGILVRTGKYASGDEDLFDGAPTWISDNLADAVDWILQSRG